MLVEAFCSSVSKLNSQDLIKYLFPSLFIVLKQPKDQSILLKINSRFEHSFSLRTVEPLTERTLIF